MNIKFDGVWTLYVTDPHGVQQKIPAQVPGNVLGDLVRGGLMPDPYFGVNSLAFREWEYCDWCYSTRFTAPEFNRVSGEKLELVFGGVDTVAEYYLDGKKFAESANMFIEQRFDLTELVESGSEHCLDVKIFSPVNYARHFDVPVQARAQDYNYESLYLRKARHSFGWDIFPRLPGGGLWRPIHFEVKPATDWGEIYLRTIRIISDGAVFFLDWSIQTNEKRLDDFSAEITLTCGDQHFKHAFTPRFIRGRSYFFLPKPKLWFPAGSGEQNLYDVELTLFLHDKKVAVKKFQTAARTIALDYCEKAQGAEEDRFNFIINGQKIYIRGINHVPVDALHGENGERRFDALRAALDLHCNMVRIWGGGVYEDDDFYDWCDRHGMLVWQDFMFACECPPHDEWYLREVSKEAESVLKKLRNHPSLALLCGDNECDGTQRGASPYLLPSFNKITRQILPEAVGEHAPEIVYIPSSPFISDDVWKFHGRFQAPELHPWGDRYDWKSNYYHDLFQCAFISEVGYPGLNSLSSLRRYLPENVLNIKAVVENAQEWHVHASAPFGAEHSSFSFRVPLMAKHVERSFGKLPENMEELVEESQVTHAEAMKTFVEMYRVQRSKKGGLILWNLLDGWPQSTEALLDYYMVPKKAFEYVKRAQQELCLILPEPVSWRAVPVIVNDRNTAASGHWQISDLAEGKILCEGEYSIGANQSCHLTSFEHRPKAMQLLLLEWDDGKEHFYNHALLGNAPYDYALYKKCFENFLNQIKKEK